MREECVTLSVEPTCLARSVARDPQQVPMTKHTWSNNPYRTSSLSFGVYSKQDQCRAWVPSGNALIESRKSMDRCEL